MRASFRPMRRSRQPISKHNRACEAAAIYGRAYSGSPQLYRMLRSLDTLGTIVNPGTKLILRTDAAPFRALVDGRRATDRFGDPERVVAPRSRCRRAQCLDAGGSHHVHSRCMP